jgi:hypothetical protein
MSCGGFPALLVFDAVRDVLSRRGEFCGRTRFGGGGKFGDAPGCFVVAAFGWQPPASQMMTFGGSVVGCGGLWHFPAQAVAGCGG